jgi:hypothetical protein
LRRIEQLQIGQTNAETITDEDAKDPESHEQHDDLPDDAALP